MSSLIRATHVTTRLIQENVNLLRYLGGSKNVEFGKLIQSRSIVSNQWSGDNIPKTHALVARYSEYAAVGRVFDQQTNKRNIDSWSALILGHYQNGSAFEVLRLFKSMVSEHDESCLPNNYISSLVLISCVNVGYVLLGRQCHGYMLKSGLVFHHYVKSALLHLYCMMSDMVGAVEVLVSVPQVDNLAYKLIKLGPDEKAYLDEAFNMLRRMLAEDMMWNKATYIGLFGLCGRLLDYDLGRQVHNKLLKSEVEFDVSVCNAMMKMYGKRGRGVAKAVQVFGRFKARNVVTWTLIMATLSEWEWPEDSLILFYNMQREEDVAPNESTFSVMLAVSAQLSSLRCGNSFHALVEKNGFKGHKNVEDALLIMYLKTGDIKAAENVFLGMRTYNRDIGTWNIMICGYCLHGFGNESLALFHEMLKVGELDPNDDTFVGVLNACGDLRLVEEGFYYLYELMKEKGLEPGLEHYRCMFNILIKAGRLKKAFDLVVSTPVLKRDGRTWSGFLRACRARKNSFLHLKAAYAMADEVWDISQWHGATDVREEIEIKNDRLVEPGSSWVEIKDYTYVAESVAKGDPMFVERHKMVKSLFASINNKPDADVPDTGNNVVLHDEVEVEVEVEDEIIKEESCDGYHSEKLAVAYALLNTHKAAPICIVMKSGKICDDCHSFMKLISKAKKRLITVRDSKRFHHFQDGSCSCADYW